MSGANAMTFGKSNAKVYVEAQTGKTFADVAGEDEAKEALKEIVDFLHNPKKYAEIGATLPKALCWWVLPAPARPCLPSGGRGSKGSLFLHFRIGICRNVRGYGRCKGTRPF
mgnify:CR=1 FL=1